MQRQLRFTKMQGAGNDFVMVNAYASPLDLTVEDIRYICDRRFGVGCEQMLVVEKSDLPDVDFKYRIFNQDGGEVEMCGNGARCFAVFVRDEGLTDKKTIRCETMKGVIAPTVETQTSVTVDMGAPRFNPEEVGFIPQGIAALTRAEDKLYQIKAGGEDNWVSIVSMGNPHAVKLVGDAAEAAVAEIGADFQKHPAFPHQVNVGFLQIVDRTHVKLRVFERGVGETLACGTGACAAVVAGIRRGALDSRVEVEMAGGRLTIAWAGEGESVYLTGPAVIVFKGEMTLP
ncbi:MAG: diaminopimelate epimerase [Sutterellaceae bacterium]|nr:diaminopimelate epimerase [Sutterellaceae bacterium]